MFRTDDSCVSRRRPCIVRAGIFPSAGGIADCDRCGDGGNRKLEDWGTADVLHDSLGADGLVRPLVPIRPTYSSENGADMSRTSETFSQHQNENIEMTVADFGTRLAEGESLQLRLTLADWQERNATSGATIDPSLPLGTFLKPQSDV